MYRVYFKSPIGLLEIIFDDSFSLKKILITDFVKDDEKEPEFAVELIKQLILYFRGELTAFSYSFNIKHVSDFDKRVLELIGKIPYGKTVTYSWIAKRLNTSPRAVGQALKRNPLPIIIPCHRVIKSDGTIGGYSLGVESKRWLIEHERSTLSKFL
ncbi:MAG: methylated-DNA--[protein]-cysteine S-methyltransferase [Thermodesulfovibrio sp.]|nr:methylated-DNA--[protein]-cysteine S-methyltransferase [Thermodesulfovibrio sp.]MDW7999061.1 methylated-DNA--[protein]-cysteine S-methyltransferase [Thermodesulfovibrio sp.]